MEMKKEGIKLRHIIGTILILVGTVLLISCFYNGFWLGEYPKAAFHGIVAIISINGGLTLD